jgi:cytochrome c5
VTEEPAEDAVTVEVPVVDAVLAKQGWELMEEKCTICHPLATVTEARLDWDGWKTAVAHMVDNGAALNDAEQEAVLAYLGTRDQVAIAGPELVDEKCVICHPTQQVEDANNDWDGWETAVDHMIENGAPLDDNERAVIIEYLAVRDLQ